MANICVFIILMYTFYPTSYILFIESLFLKNVVKKVVLYTNRTELLVKLAIQFMYILIKV